MYLRPHTRRKNGVLYEYWTLEECIRTADGPRQRTVASLGKLPSLNEEVRIGWEHIRDVLDGHPPQGDLFKSSPDPPVWARVDTSRTRVERLRRFGEVYLGLALWRRLQLDSLFTSILPEGKEEVPWQTMACILVLARFCSPSSELHIAEFWYGKTALEDLLGIAPEHVNDDRLYRALDILLPHKDTLFRHFQRVYGELFGVTFDLLLYDITSTYFEGCMEGNTQARRGYSRDGRPDCVQLCIALVVTPEGLPLAYEIFDGNRTDVTTVDEIVAVMREKYGQARRTWVMDRGMVSEDNLQHLRDNGAHYLVGTPKSVLKQFEQQLLDTDWDTVEPGVEVKLCTAPDGTQETYVLCRSQGRIEKERAIREKQRARLYEALHKLKAQIDASQHALRNRSTAERRVGRLSQKYTRAARFFDVTITTIKDCEHKSKKRLTITITSRKEHDDWVELSDGCYLLRTNLTGYDAQTLWKTYIGLTQIEDTFRISKHDLGIHPIFHQKRDRAQAHILVCFLALVMWRTLQQWMEGCALGTAPRKLLAHLAEVRSLDIVMPTDAGREIRLRTVSRPENHLAILLHKLGLPLPNKPMEVQ